MQTSTAIARSTEHAASTFPSDELWEKLSHFEFDQPGPHPFSIRLAVENAWTGHHTWDVLEEYRKLLYLIATVGNDLIGSPDIDIAWRLHLIYSESYRKNLCMEVLGKFIPHECHDGSEPADVTMKRFQKTLQAYRAAFGEPPATLWQAPMAKGLPLLQRWQVTRALAQETKRIEKSFLTTPENIPAQHQLRWRNIRDFALDKPNATYPFSRRLAEENDWTLAHALLVIREYKRFMYLCATSGYSVTPSLDVDEAWHLHQENTDSYWEEFCKKTLGKLFGHSPGNGSKEDDFKFEAVYERTLHDYTQVFGPPPREVFGTPPRTVWGIANPSINWAERLQEAVA